MKKRKIRNLFLVGGIGFVIIALCIGALALYATRGILWSTDMPIYGQMLQTLPNPPGLIAEGDRVDLTPYHQWGQRNYWVDMEHFEIVRFFGMVHFPPEIG